MAIYEVQRGEYTLSTDPARLDLAAIHAFLSQQTYWAKDRSLEVVQRSVENSLNFGVYHRANQVGFARVITDYATFAWVCDVYILPEYRQQGLGKWLIESLVAHPLLQPLRRLLLATRDAHGLYQTYGGFQLLHNPERWMEKFTPSV